MSALLKKFWPTVVMLAGGLWAGFGTQIQSFVASNPKASAVAGIAAVIVAHLAPSPLSKPSA